MKYEYEPELIKGLLKQIYFKFNFYRQPCSNFVDAFLIDFLAKIVLNNLNIRIVEVLNTHILHDDLNVSCVYTFCYKRDRKTSELIDFLKINKKNEKIGRFKYIVHAKCFYIK